MLQFVLHVKCVPHAVKSCDLDGAYDLPGVKKDELAERLCSRGVVELDIKQTVLCRLDMGMILGI